MANTTEQALNKAREALEQAYLQIEYLHGKYQATGSGNAVCAQINEALAALTAASAEAATPFGYFHELLNHEGRGTGVWMGCPDKDSTEKSYVEGEVGKEIVTLYAAPQASQPIGQTAEDYLRSKYGAYRVHHAWRELEEAFNAGKTSNSQPVSGAGMTDEEIERLALKHIATLYGKVGPAGDYKQTEQFRRIKAYTMDLLSAICQAVSEKATMWADALNARADWEEKTTKLATPGTIKLMRDVSEFLSSTPAQTEAPVNVLSGFMNFALEAIGTVALHDDKSAKELAARLRTLTAAAPAPAQTEAQQSEKDAERYRWLRQFPANFGTPVWVIYGTGLPLDRVFIDRAERLDAAIDAAIAKEKAKS